MKFLQGNMLLWMFVSLATVCTDVASQESGALKADFSRYQTYPGCGVRFLYRKHKSKKAKKYLNEEEIPCKKDRIVGGIEAQRNSWPWMASLFIRKQDEDEITCGASLISENFLLTAGHCFKRDKNLKKHYLVMLEAHKYDDGIKYDVERVILHPEYSFSSHYNDIALLKLREPVTLSERAYPVCLPVFGLDQPFKRNEDVYVTGWGRLDQGADPSEYLLEVKVPVVPFNECAEIYNHLGLKKLPRGLDDGMMCAGYREGGKDACQGDSGGPLVRKMYNNTYVQVGVVSFGLGCAQPGIPGVYSNVARFMDFISDFSDVNVPGQYIHLK